MIGSSYFIYQFQAVKVDGAMWTAINGDEIVLRKLKELEQN